MKNNNTGLNLLKKIKNSNFSEISKYEVNINGFEEYKIRPITLIKSYQSIGDIECLTKWRNLYRKSFLTDFIATNERTSNWLEESVLKDDKRILFMVENNQGKNIGYMGMAYIDWSRKYAETDSIVRGEPAPKGLMSSALRSLIQWGKNFLGIENIYVRVLDDNPAIKFYEKMGFVKVREVGLRIEKKESSTNWIEDKNIINPTKKIIYHRWEANEY